MLSFLLLLLTCLAYYIYRYYKWVAKYPPGPTPLPFLGNMLQLKNCGMHKQLERMADTYGPVFTIFTPQPLVIITGLDPMKEALIKKGEIFAGRPQGSPINSPLSTKPNSGVIASVGGVWREQRRFALHTLRDFGLGRTLMEEKINSSIETMVEHMQSLIKDNNGVFDITLATQLCVGNIINELLFGYHFKPDNCEQFFQFKMLLDRSLFKLRNNKSTFLISAYPWMVHVPLIGRWGYWDIRNDFMAVKKFIDKEISQQMEAVDYNAEPNTFTEAYLQELKRTEKEGRLSTFSHDQLADVLIDFWIAGMETTASTLRWAISILTRYPDIQEKLYEEIERVVGKDRVATMADKLNMPYTTAFILELQRKANLLTFNLFHSTLADTDIGGLAIPKNTVVVPQITSVMDDPKIFPNPECFNPDRFLEADGQTIKKELTDAVVPFSLGKRQCAGEPLARMELFLILVALVQKFKFSVPEGCQPPDLMPIHSFIQVPRLYQPVVAERA